LRKILIANRGEIAVRVIRACRDMGLRSVAVYSECDRAARHVRLADEAVAIGGNPPSDSYLRIDRIVDAARRTGADAVHPGYGFLAENELFAAGCRDAGLTFIGPSPEAIALMGSKTAARRAAAQAGVPVVPGTDSPLDGTIDDATIAGLAQEIGYPIMIKAVAGGGGKGMRLVSSPDDLPAAIRAARSEAASAFGDGSIYLERRLQRPRHIEVQLLADHHGTVLPFVERECSIQRRHQKVVEESPSPVVTPDLRARMTEAAAAIARAVQYTNAGTIEFLVEDVPSSSSSPFPLPPSPFYFLEMNTRLQVEHPITELVTGIDLVQWQIRIARGERLDIDPASLLVPRGHAIECRIYAEDPDAGFLPSPGRIHRLQSPQGPGIRDDSGAESGAEVPIYYDPLISKLAGWGATRADAIARLQRALREYHVEGIRTTVPFFRWLLQQKAFTDAAFHTGYLDEVLQQRQGVPFEAPDDEDSEVAAVAAALYREPHPVGVGIGRRSDHAGVRPPRIVRRDAGWTRVGRLEALRQ
jgi:acetyl-CoA carboxylase biotin carboxylase subunit